MEMSEAEFQINALEFALSNLLNRPALRILRGEDETAQLLDDQSCVIGLLKNDGDNVRLLLFDSGIRLIVCGYRLPDELLEAD